MAEAKQEVRVILFVSYAVGMAALIWYLLIYLPFPQLTQHISFALNIVQFALVSLLSFLVYRQESTFRSIFFQFWFLFAYLACIPAIMFGCLDSYGAAGGVVSTVLTLILLHGLLLWLGLKVLIGYVFYREKQWIINAVCLMVVLPTCIWLFWPFWWSPEHISELSTANNPDTYYDPILMKFVISNIVSILLLLAFFVHKLRTDRPIGVYADTMLFFFVLYLVIDTGEFVLKASSVELMSLTQWAAALVTAAMIVTLLFRLKFKSQTIANYYESQCLSGDPRIDRRIGRFDRFIVRCFFDPQKVGQRVFLGAGNEKMKVKRSSSRVMRNVDQD